MSSSAEPPLGWGAFNEREVPDARGELFSPESEITGLVRWYEEELRKARGEADAAAGKVRETVFDLAVLVGRLGQLVAEAEALPAERDRETLVGRFRVVKNQMLQTLREDAIEVLDPTGRPAAAVADWSEVAAWFYKPEFEAEVVARTEACAVFRNGEAVRLARVEMGAPSAREDGEDT
ncbi:MAG: hypothetical protein ACJ786_23250 [Catenulispora sp.]